MASGLGLHYLPLSHKKDARLIWVNSYVMINNACDSKNVADKNGLIRWYVFDD